MKKIADIQTWKPPAVRRVCQSKVRELAGRDGVSIAYMLDLMIFAAYEKFKNGKAPK